MISPFLNNENKVLGVWEMALSNRCDIPCTFLGHIEVNYGLFRRKRRLWDNGYIVARGQDARAWAGAKGSTVEA